MSTLLECYKTCKAIFDSELQSTIPDPSLIWQHQERLYRLEVLEVCCMFLKTAPLSTNVKDLHWHYQMVDAFFQGLTLERRYSVNTGEDAQKQRDTAYANLLKVIGDYRKRFSSFTPANDAGCYQKAITDVVHIVLPVWLQYRQTYIKIETIKEAA